MVRQPAQAFAAAAAGPRRRHGDQIADREAGDFVTQFDDVAGDFVAEDHRFAQPDGAEPAVVEIVQVRPADTAARQCDPQLARFGGVRRCFCQTQIARGVGVQSLHCRFSF